MVELGWNRHQPSLWLYDLSLSYSVFHTEIGYYFGKSVVWGLPRISGFRLVYSIEITKLSFPFFPTFFSSHTSIIVSAPFPLVAITTLFLSQLSFFSFLSANPQKEIYFYIFIFLFWKRRYICRDFKAMYGSSEVLLTVWDFKTKLKFCSDDRSIYILVKLFKYVFLGYLKDLLCCHAAPSM